jgi:hypothetical protein
VYCSLAPGHKNEAGAYAEQSCREPQKVVQQEAGKGQCS